MRLTVDGSCLINSSWSSAVTHTFPISCLRFHLFLRQSHCILQGCCPLPPSQNPSTVSVFLCFPSLLFLSSNYFFIFQLCLFSYLFSLSDIPSLVLSWSSCTSGTHSAALCVFVCAHAELCVCMSTCCRLILTDDRLRSQSACSPFPWPILQHSLI